MPTVYEGRCSFCGHESPAGLSRYPAVLRLDGGLAVLRHPAEDHDLARQGLTYFQAGWEGRFVVCDRSVCRACGGFYEHRKIVFPGGQGCLPALASGVIVALLGRFMFGSPTSDAVFVGFCVFAAISALVDAVLDACARWRAGRLGRSVADERCCEQARGGVLVPLGNAPGKGPFPCPACGWKTMHYGSAGIA